MDNIRNNLNLMENVFQSLGQPIGRFKVSISNFPFLDDRESDDVLYMLIENNIKSFSFPSFTFNYIEDEYYGNLNLIPNVPYSLSNLNENNISLTILFDEFKFNYMLFLQWSKSLIKKTRDLENKDYVESNEEYFINELIFDMFDNQGNPELVYSIKFKNLVLISLGEFSTEQTSKEFSVGLRYEDYEFNIEKMNILKKFREINNLKRE